ncbi:phospholipase A2 inhibitor-like [Limulus polyphemus]|uniref:Phospholipase A2 inhibitor-like n=1 Tax=Limulus polyphemus TaxID=6850 RepID=A0ABM1C4M4_LIMPO|nr:phospholipase A2 inhibitor-like [Limulus polyphemus]
MMTRHQQQASNKKLIRTLELATVSLVFYAKLLFVLTEAAGQAGILPLHTSNFSSVCPVEFQGRCRCGRVPYGPHGILTYVTNCTNTNFDDTHMLLKLPVETEVLIFTGNYIPDLPLNILGKVKKYGQLHTIDMSNNHIQSIKGKTFHHVEFVKKLVLNDNDLYIVSKDVHSRMFSNFYQLEELHLKNAFTEKVRVDDYFYNLVTVFKDSNLNHLQVLNLEENEFRSMLNENFFCYMRTLMKIYMKGNRMTDFRLNTTCLPRLEILDLSENEIPYLTNQTLHRFDAVPGLEINLAGNPFQCDCYLVDMYRWLTTTKTRVINKETFQCFSGFPRTNAWKLVNHVPLHDLKCPLKLSDFQNHISASVVVLVLLIIICVVLVSVLTYRHRQAIYIFARSWFQPFNSKMKYSSMDKRDETEMEV